MLAEKPLAESPNPQAMQDRWILAQGEEEGRPILLRLRSETPPGIELGDYPILLNVYWGFKDPDNNGMPSDSTLAAMGDLEKSLDELEYAGHGFFTLSITGNQRKEWIWYIRDRSEFMRELNRVLGGHEPFPIELRAQQDSEWQAYKSLASQFQKR